MLKLPEVPAQKINPKQRCTIAHVYFSRRDRLKKLNIFTLQKFIGKNLDLVGTKQNGKKLSIFSVKNKQKYIQENGYFFIRKYKKRTNIKLNSRTYHNYLNQWSFERACMHSASGTNVASGNFNLAFKSNTFKNWILFIRMIRRNTLMRIKNINCDTWISYLGSVPVK